MAKVRAEEHCSAAAAAAVDRRVAGEEEDNGLEEAEAAVDSILPAGVEDNGLAEEGIGLAAEDTGRSLPVVAVLLDISKRAVSASCRASLRTRSSRMEGLGLTHDRRADHILDTTF